MTVHRPAFVALAVLGAILACALGRPPVAAAVTCPAANPVVNENNCKGSGSTGWRLTNYDNNGVAGFAAKPSVNVGSPVTLDIGAFDTSNDRVDISVYRIGYYGGTGGRLVNTATNVTVNNSYGCGAPDSTTGLVACDGWDPTYTVPASALTTSGVYIARLRATESGNENAVLFVVRDDGRHADILYKLPTATYQAYNNWGGKSMYDWNSFGSATVTGGNRAAKVSFLRPLADLRVGDNWFQKSDYAMVFWLEKQGYDVSYTEDVSVSQQPSQLLDHRIDMVAGHDEYWTGEEMHGYKAARDAGVSVASFSGNTAYWKTRLEDGGDTLVTYKTVQGSGTNGAAGQNDWGPDGIKGTADDALGPRRHRRHRRRPAAERDDDVARQRRTVRLTPNAPPGGRVGPDEPENSLFGNMYVGDNDSVSYPLEVPAGNAQAVRRRPHLAPHRRRRGDRRFDRVQARRLGVGRHPDQPAVPRQAAQPASSRSARATTTEPSGSEWLDGRGSRVRATSPPPGQPGTPEAVGSALASGAWVFARPARTSGAGASARIGSTSPAGRPAAYQDPPTDSTAGPPASRLRAHGTTWALETFERADPDSRSRVGLDGTPTTNRGQQTARTRPRSVHRSSHREPGVSPARP